MSKAAAAAEPGATRRLPWLPLRPAERASLLILLASVAAFVVVRTVFVHQSYFDLKVYRAEGAAIVHHARLYGHLDGVVSSATYPVFAAILFVPFALVSQSVAEVCVTVANLAALLWCGYASCRLLQVQRRRAWFAGALVAAVLIWSEPVYTTLNYGQVDLFVLALVLWDFTRDPSSRVRGVGIGVATAMKVTPGIFVVYLLLTRRFRFGLTALGAFLVTLAISAAADARDTWSYWTHYLFDTTRVGSVQNTVNQSIRGLAVRAAHTLDTGLGETLVVAAVLVVGLACAAVAYRRLGEAWGVSACAVTGLLCSPISWTHHWVWCVPIGVLLWYRARAWLPLAVVVFSSYLMWTVPADAVIDLHMSDAQLVRSSVYVVFGLFFLALTARQLRNPASIPKASG